MVSTPILEKECWEYSNTKMDEVLAIVYNSSSLGEIVSKYESEYKGIQKRRFRPYRKIVSEGFVETRNSWITPTIYREIELGMCS